MDRQRRLVITLAVEVTVPPQGLDFNSLVAAFRRFGHLSTTRLFEVALSSLEQRLGERLMADHPGRFVWNGFHAKMPKRWTLPFGEVQHRYRRLRDRHSGKHVVPLRDGLDIPLRNRFTWATVAGPVGLASELSFRRAAREGRRLQDGLGPGKSTTWAYFQKLPLGLEPWAPPSQRTVEVLLADGTKLKRQQRGHNLLPMDLRLVLSERRDGSQFQVVAFDLDAEWPVLKRRLQQACPTEKIGVLLSDGEAGIEALADATTRLQRCLLHGPRGLRTVLYKDGLTKRRQDPILRHLLSAQAWRTNAAALATLPEQSRDHLRQLLDEARRVCKEILEQLPPRATRARHYLKGFLQDGLAFLQALLDGEPSLPGVTTNAAENVFSQMDTRLKGIGRRWSLSGATSMVCVLLTKIFRPELWQEHLKSLRGLPGTVTITATILDHGWQEAKSINE